MSAPTRGFTIVEALIAIVVLIGVLFALLGIVPQSFSYAERDAQRSQALGTAQQYLDTLREYVANNKFTATSLPSPAPASIDGGDTFAGSVAETSPGTFGLTNNGCPLVGGSAKMFDCVVTVSWTEAGVPRTATLESYVTQQI